MIHEDNNNSSCLNKFKLGVQLLQYKDSAFPNNVGPDILNALHQNNPKPKPLGGLYTLPASTPE